MSLNKLICVDVVKRGLLVILFSTCFATASFSSDMKNAADETGTYSKVYWVKVDPAKADATWEYFDSVVVPWAKASEHHAAFTYQVIASEPGQWILVANYQNKEAAEAAAPSVGKIVGPMVEKFGMKLETITAGDIFRLVKKN